jgi:hypothetical protein
MSAQVNWAASGLQIYAAGVGDIDTTDGELRLLARPWAWRQMPHVGLEVIATITLSAGRDQIRTSA